MYFGNNQARFYMFDFEFIEYFSEMLQDGTKLLAIHSIKLYNDIIQLLGMLG